ncbi:hypothetical protein K0B96_02805 [Horticoccus luteus]|uniref:Uncharacterized protein n=1 Tax=Horticoccus luteus TaxID=2862869 RepID=A0A8F9TXA4_9BACT|nr:hypothetical protein [Horticoccus luteus]QYM79564.1 hypothetical protein K0B96_02805 [Horticoccus luteus]
MRKILQRKPKAATAPMVPAWHPNFRDYERLPDVKVVRTAFLVNGAAIVVMTALLLWVAFNEYHLRDLRSRIEAWDAQIHRNRVASARAVALYKKFQTDEARLREIDAFVKSKPAFSPLMLRLGATLPATMALDAVTWRDGSLSLRGTVRGSPDAASGYASAYVERLRTDAELGPLFESVTLTSVARHAVTGRLLVEIVLAGKGTSKPVAKK